MKINLKYLVIFILFFLIEIFIALFIRDKFIRPFVGDVLVVILIYFLLKSFFIINSNLLPLYILLFAFFIEFCQYFNLAKIFGLDRFKLIMIVFGSTFDTVDLLCYFVGFLFLLLFQYYSKAKS